MSSLLTPSPPAASTALPESDQLYEIVDGVRVEKPVSAASAWIASRLDQRLGPHAEDEGIGTVVIESMFILDKTRDLRRRPDVAFVAAAKWPVGQMPPVDGDWEMVPDLAIEIISPNNRYSEVLRKLHEYFEYGVQEVWLITPEERLAQVYQTPDDMRTVRAGESLSTDLVSGWSIEVSTLIPEITPAQPSPSA